MAVEERAASTGASWRRTQRAIRRDATGRLPAGTPSTRQQRIILRRRGVKVARATASASALSSPSSPAPAVKQPAAPEQLPALRAQPVGHHVERTRCDHHHGQHGTASINQALGRGQPPRAAGAAGPAATPVNATPSPGRCRLDGVSVVRSCARPRGDARAVAAAAPSPRVDAASCRGRPYHPGVGCRVFSARRLGGGRAVAPHERPARMMGGSASEQRPRERRPTPRHRRDTASARWRASRPTHTK